jgi:S-adenosylmethionine:tRNA ribosyltransferase-isomerase
VAHRARVISGLRTGFHEPRSSHLGLLVTVAGTELVSRCYDEALAGGYRWHEFGDLNLLLAAGADRDAAGE